MRQGLAPKGLRPGLKLALWTEAEEKTVKEAIESKEKENVKLEDANVGTERSRVKEEILKQTDKVTQEDVIY